MHSATTTATASASEAGNDQAALWNGTGGQAWVDNQDLLDHLFQPLAARLADTAGAVSARRVLDIGCGTGATTRAVARALDAGGECLGVDVSVPMIEAARAREALPNARFLVADAQRHAFETAAFDMLVSRFGVMFFDDPVAAFANLRRAAAPGARLCVLAWRGPDQNPFMTVAGRAAAPLLQEAAMPLSAPAPGAPGQFGFADPERVRRILDAGGWQDIEIQPLDVGCRMPESALERYFTRLGALGQALHRVDSATRARIVAAVRPAFDPFVDGESVRFDAACWQIEARSGDPAGVRR